ncbi:MAG: TetR/AcrR family transcriptional regulator [Mycobacteriales bacterium]
MARYGKEHKEATRTRILTQAGRRLKQDGIDGSGVATLMADAGLTNGAFYAHFASKEDLVTQVISSQLDAQAERFAALSPGMAGVEEFIRLYLSPEHRDEVRDGCPSAALLDEITRGSDATRDAYTRGVLHMIDGLAERVAPLDPASARMTVLSTFALMIGTVQLARTFTDRELSDAVLAQGVTSALAILAQASGPQRSGGRRARRLSELPAVLRPR